VIANAETFSDNVPHPNQTVTVTNNIGNGGGGGHHTGASAHAHYAEERPRAYYYRDSPRLGVFDEYYSPSGYASSYYRGGPPCDDGTAPWLAGKMNLPPCSRATVNGGNISIAEALLLAQAANGGSGSGSVDRSGGDRNATALTTMAAVTATAVAVAVVSAGLLLTRSR